MKRKEIQNLLNNQLDSIAPKMSESVKNTPLNTIGREEECQEEPTKRKGQNVLKWTYAVACAVVVVVIALSLGLYFGLNPSENVDGAPQMVCYVVDINPSIAITADKDGKVVHLSSQNEEGDLVLSSAVFDDYRNMSVNQCVNAVIEQSARLGYIDCNSKDNKVTLTLIGDDRNNVISLDTIATGAQNFLRKLNVFGIIETATKDVKSYVESKGWKYDSSSLEGYIDLINMQSKYVRGNKYGGDFGIEAEKYVEEYFQGIMAKKDLLDKLGAKLDEVEKSNDKIISYWIYKGLEGTALEPTLSSDTKALIKDCDSIVASLNSLGINLSGTIEYAWYIAKYSIVEDLKCFVDNAKDYIYDDEFFDLFLPIVDEKDRQKFEILKKQIKDYHDDVIVTLLEEYNERLEQYKSIFEGRASISDSEYDEFLKGMMNN